MIIPMICFGAVCGLTWVYLIELVWENRPPSNAVPWPKGRATRFVWACLGMLALLGPMPLGIVVLLAGLPVCLAHLRLVDRDPRKKIRVTEVVEYLCHTARGSFRQFMDRTKIARRR